MKVYWCISSEKTFQTPCFGAIITNSEHQLIINRCQALCLGFARGISFNSHKTTWSKVCYHFHFADEKNEVQRLYNLLSVLKSEEMTEWGLELRSDCKAYVLSHCALLIALQLLSFFIRKTYITVTWCYNLDTGSEHVQIQKKIQLYLWNCPTFSELGTKPPLVFFLNVHLQTNT